MATEIGFQMERLTEGLMDGQRHNDIPGPKVGDKVHTNLNFPNILLRYPYKVHIVMMNKTAQ